MRRLSALIALVLTAACVGLSGCQKHQEARASYDANDIEAYLDAHPELKDLESGNFEES